MSEGAAPVLISEGEKALLSLGRTRFEDVQDEVVGGRVWANAAAVGKVYPDKLGHNVTELKKAYETIDLEAMEGRWDGTGWRRTGWRGVRGGTSVERVADQSLFSQLS